MSTNGDEVFNVNGNLKEIYRDRNHQVLKDDQGNIGLMVQDTTASTTVSVNRALRDGLRKQGRSDMRFLLLKKFDGPVMVLPLDDPPSKEMPDQLFDLYDPSKGTNSQEKRSHVGPSADVVLEAYIPKGQRDIGVQELMSRLPTDMEVVVHRNRVELRKRTK